MFFCILTTCTSLSFCYRPNSGFPECENKSSISINNIEEVRSFIQDDTTEVIIEISNNIDTIFKVDNNISGRFPITLIGVQRGFIEVSKVLGSVSSNYLLSLNNLSVKLNDFDGNVKIDNIKMRNVIFTNQDFIIESVLLDSDLVSLKALNHARSQNSHLYIFNHQDILQHIKILLPSYSNTIYFYGFPTTGYLYAMQKSISLTFSGETIPSISVSFDQGANALAMYANILDSVFYVDSDPYLNHITLDPTLNGNGKIIFGKSTNCLSTYRDFIVNNGTIVSYETDLQFRIRFSANGQTTLSFTNKLHFYDSYFENHEVYCIVPIGSVFSSQLSKIVGGNKFYSVNSIQFCGDTITFDDQASFDSDHVEFGSFSHIIAPPLGIELRNFRSSHSSTTITIPHNIIRVGKINVLTPLTSVSTPIKIVLTHDMQPDENQDMYNLVVNQLTNLFCAPSIDCSMFDVQIGETADPWEDSHILFTKERIVIEKVCSSTCFGVKIRENPGKTYETIMVAEDWQFPSTYGMFLVKPSEFETWERLPTEFTKGISFKIHNSVNIPIDLSNALQPSQVVELRIAKSEYTYAENQPLVVLSSESLDAHCHSLLLDDIYLDFDSIGPVSLNVDSMVVLHNTTFADDFSAKHVSELAIQDSLLSTFPLDDIARLTVYIDSSNSHLIFRDDGWTITEESFSRFIESRIDLTIRTTGRFYLDVDPQAKTPHTITLLHYGNSPWISIDPLFEKFADQMPPITFYSKQEYIALTVNGGYLPFWFTDSFRLNVGTSSSHLLTKLPPQIKFKGNNALFSPNDVSYIELVTIPKFIIQEPTKSGLITLEAMNKFLFEEIRIDTIQDVNMKKVRSSKLVISNSGKTNYEIDSYLEFTDIDIHITLGTSSTTSLSFTGTQNVSPKSIFISIDQASTDQPIPFTRSIINDDNQHLNLKQMASRINLSTTTVYVKGKIMRLSLVITDVNVILVATSGDKTPTIPPYPSIMPTATISGHDPEDNGKSSSLTTIILSSVTSIFLVSIGVVAAFYYYNNKKILSDYESISGDVLIRESINV